MLQAKNHLKCVSRRMQNSEHPTAGPSDYGAAVCAFTQPTQRGPCGPPSRSDARLQRNRDTLHTALFVLLARPVATALASIKQSPTIRVARIAATAVRSGSLVQQNRRTEDAKADPDVATDMASASTPVHLLHVWRWSGRPSHSGH